MKYISFIISLLMMGSVWAQTQLTLDSCHKKAYENYPLIHQFELIEQTKEMTLSNANKAYLPQLDITLIGGILEGLPSFAPPGTEESSVNTQLIAMGQLNQVIWDGGLTKANKQMIEANSDLESADIQINLYQLKDRINHLYFGVLLIDEQIVQLDILKETLIRNQKRVQIAIENGTAFQSDEDELKVELINAQQKQDELNYNKQSYLAVLSLMIGEDIDKDVKLIRPMVSQPLSNLTNHRLELMKFNSQRALINAQADLNKASLMPKFGLMGFGVFLNPGMEFGTSDLNNIFVAGLSLNWQLLPLYKNKSNKQLTEINLQRIQNQEQTFLFNTNLELKQTTLEMDKLKKLIEQDSELLVLKSSIKDAYISKYENGVVTMSAMLDRINDENMSKQNMIMHEIQYIMKAYQYLNKSGN